MLDFNNTNKFRRNNFCLNLAPHPGYPKYVYEHLNSLIEQITIPGTTIWKPYKTQPPSTPLKVNNPYHNQPHHHSIVHSFVQLSPVLFIDHHRWMNGSATGARACESGKLSLSFYNRLMQLYHSESCFGKVSYGAELKGSICRLLTVDAVW